jgi:tetratricopeptide (TPR) repeat protein
MHKARQLVDQGLALHQQGRLREAAACYGRALALNANFGPALHYLGLTLAQQGMADVGRGLLEKALAAGEDHAELRFNLGWMLEQSGKPELALIQYQAASRQAPQNVDAWDALVRLHDQRGDADAAASALVERLQLQPDHVPTLLAMARNAYRRNDVAAACRYFEEAYARQPSVLNESNIGFAEPAEAAEVFDPLPRLKVDGDADTASVQEVLSGAELHIFDDFLPDPLAAREWARGLHFSVLSGNYPGAQTGPMRCNEQLQRIADRLGRRIKWASPDNGVVRLTLADATARSDIHVDDERAVENAPYAAVLYLTLPEHCQGGTSFWRHRATGWLKRPDDATVRTAGFVDFKSFLRAETPLAGDRAFQQLAAERAKWQRLLTLPMRFNRLVVYRSNYFHAVDSIFGHDFDDGRLTWLFTFEAC